MNLTTDQKNAIMIKLQDYFYEERSEELGRIGAENLYAFFMKELAPFIYNLAIKDAKRVIDQEWANLSEEIDVLARRLP